MEVKYVKLRPEAQPPQRQTSGSAGYDLFACLEAPAEIPPGQVLMAPLGFGTEIPEGLAGFVFSRSGLGAKQGIVVAQGVGVIDSDYRGEWMVPLRNLGPNAYTVHPGDRVAQVVFLPVALPVLQEAATLAETRRGQGGFGSTSL